MVKPIPSRFNPELLARDTTQYSANLPLGQFSRLRKLLLDDSSAQTAEMSAVFRLSRRKRLVVASGTLKAIYHLKCQRCLEPMQYEIDEPFELVFAKTEAVAQEMSDSYDPVVLDDNGQIHIVDLFEDELILHLPNVARHAQLSECESEYIQDEATVEENVGERQSRKNPFDVLKNLDLH